MISECNTEVSAGLKDTNIKSAPREWFRPLLVILLEESNHQLYCDWPQQSQGGSMKSIARENGLDMFQTKSTRSPQVTDKDWQTCGFISALSNSQTAWMSFRVIQSHGCIPKFLRLKKHLPDVTLIQVICILEGTWRSEESAQIIKDITSLTGFALRLFVIANSACGMTGRCTRNVVAKLFWRVIGRPSETSLNAPS